MNIYKKFEDWLETQDCYGNPMVGEWEKETIKDHFKALKKSDIEIVYGDEKKDQPNTIMLDITSLSSPDFQPGKIITVTLAHYIRPCPCSDCSHTWQYECYLNDCLCCTDECT